MSFLNLEPVAKTTVSNKVTQKSVYKPYKPGSAVCSCGRCNANTFVEFCSSGDWEYGRENCCHGTCPSQPLCSQLDPKVCPNIAGGAKKIWDPAPSVLCTYETVKFKTTDDIQGWINQWGQDEQYNNVIMPYFCNLPASNCSNDPNTGKPYPECTNLNSTGKAGNLCRDWLRADIIPLDSPPPEKTWWELNSWWVVTIIFIFVIIFVFIIAMVLWGRSSKTRIYLS